MERKHIKETDLKMKRESVRILRSSEDDDGFVNATPSELFSMVWEITRDLWAFTGRDDAERRLQRNVVNIIRLDVDAEKE
jgi:hypothetical protein